MAWCLTLGHCSAWSLLCRPSTITSSVQWRDLQLMLLFVLASPCAPRCCPASSVQLRTVVLGGFVTLREESERCWPGSAEEGRQAGQGPLRAGPKGRTPLCKGRTVTSTISIARVCCQHQNSQGAHLCLPQASPSNSQSPAYPSSSNAPCRSGLAPILGVLCAQPHLPMVEGGTFPALCLSASHSGSAFPVKGSKGMKAKFIIHLEMMC